MHFWGYASHPDPAMESPTQFAKYVEQTAEELSLYKEFIGLNQKLIEEERKEPAQRWEINNRASNMPMWTAFRLFTSQNEIIEVKNP